MDLASGGIESGKEYSLDQAGVWADCVQAGKPVIINHIQPDSLKYGYLDSQVAINRHLSVPLRDNDRLQFVLSVGNKASDYDSMDVLQLRLIGDFLVKRLHTRQLENTLHNAKLRYEQFAKHLPIGIYRARTTKQNQMVFEFVNQQFCEMLDLSPAEMYQDANNVFQTIHPDDLDEFEKLIRRMLQIRQPFLWEGRIIVDGEVKWMRIEANPIPLENGDTIWHGVQTDITERKHTEIAFRDANALLENRVAEIEQLQGQLREQAIRDYLTGLFNRRYLDETIDREIARAKREANLLSVIMMDIDHFKSINDTYGHQAGDMVLIQLGALLNQYSRSSDIACRHGGDEFVVVMPSASPEDAHKRADEWRHLFEKQRFTFNDRRFATTLSIGIATYPLHASSPKGVFQAADQALYQSKMYNNKVTISRRVSTNMLRSIGDSDS
jgi:diguanylate cyclase (GGDEF)-like protein/PAS domain S-box-containing protein